VALEFWWREFDVQRLLPPDWREQIFQTAEIHAKSHIIVASSVTSREATRDVTVPVLTVGGKTIHEKLPWLFELYLKQFREIGQTCCDEPVSPAVGLPHSINLNVQKVGMRYEAHVDSNPLEGLLYVTSHPEGSGGELVVAKAPDTQGIDSILRNSVKIFPKSGHLVFFDARQHPHFVTPLKNPTDIRIVVAMNYYTSSCPETARPVDLDRHLGLIS
jgi:hypothetical protein